MKKLLITLAVISTQAHGAAYDLFINQMNSDQTAVLNRQMSVPSGGMTSGMMVYDGNSMLPAVATLGSGCSISAGVFTCTGTAQVNSDWNAVSGVAQILNKPTNVSAFTNDANYVTASSLSSTLSGYATTTALTTGLAGKYDNPVGTTLQYIRGDGSLATFPTGIGSVTSVGLSSSDLSVSGSPVTTSGTITTNLVNTGTAGTYSGVTTDVKGRVTSGTNRSFSYTTRSLNTCFQANATRDVLASYAVDISTTLSLSGGQTGTVYLRTYTDSGCTTGTQEITRAVNGNTGTLTIGLNITQNVTGKLNGVIEAGKYVQLVTENTSGTPNFTARPGQEVSL